MPKSKIHPTPTPARSSYSGRIAPPLSTADLHRAMVAYGKEVSSTRETALAFLERIGAPIKAVGR